MSGHDIGNLVQTIVLLAILGVLGWCFKELFFPGIPYFMKPLMPREEKQVINPGNTSRLHRHSFKSISWDKEKHGPWMDFDKIPPGRIDPMNPPRMRDRELRQCGKNGCGAEVLVTRSSMM